MISQKLISTDLAHAPVETLCKKLMSRIDLKLHWAQQMAMLHCIGDCN